METKNGISRRDLLKIGGVAAAGALGASALAGCSSGSESSAPATGGSAFIPMSEEERIASIIDPVYMGAKTNVSGQELVLGEAPNGGIAPQAVIDKNNDFAPALHKVNDRIYCSVGNCIANCTMIIGDTGIIVIDSGENKETAQMDLDAFRTITDKPVVAMIATHEHYFQGTATFVGDGNPNNIPIIAHQLFMASKLASSTNTVDTVAYRSMQMFGQFLPAEGPDASVSAGLGAFLNNPKVPNGTSGFIVPNTYIPASETMTEMTIDGVRIQFYPMPSDSYATINMWLPDDRVAISNHVWSTFYNMYTIRGTEYRNPIDTVNAIDTILSWKPEAHVSVHGLPIIGTENCEREITFYRDGIQFIYDQTIRFMNKGMSPDEIARNVILPTEILEGEYTQPFYGDIEHYVRGIYSGLIGWFGTDPVELHPVNKDFEAKRIVEMCGGVGPVLDRVRAALDDNEFSWAATLAGYVLLADPDNRDAKQLKAAAFRQMGYVSAASNTRHWYLTNALMLEESITVPTHIPIQEGMFAASRTLIVDLFRVNLVPERAKGMSKSLMFTFDTGEVLTMSIHNCVAQCITGPVDTPDVELRMPYDLVGKCASGVTSIMAEIAAGTVELVGTIDDLNVILSIFDMDF